MALSILIYEGCGSENCRFRADIGTNTCYRYLIGQAKSSSNNLPVVEQVTHRSEIFARSEPGIFDSSFVLEISKSLFTGTDRYIQLVSCKDPSGRSPAFSEVVRLMPFQPLPEGFTPLSAISFTKAMEQTRQNSQESYCRSISYSYAASPLSQTMFWQTLLEAARILAPEALGALGSLLDNNGAGQSGNPQISDILTRLLGALQSPQAVANQPATKVTPVVSQPQSLASGFSYKSLSSGKLTGKPHQERYGRAMILDGGVLTGPLLASLLGPILQQAPGILQTVLDSPVKLFNAISARRLGQQQLEQGYLERLVADLNQRALLEQLIGSGQLARQSGATAMSFSVSNKITIDFMLDGAISVQDKPKFVYQTTGPVKLKIAVNKAAPQTGDNQVIDKVIVQFFVKDSISLKTLLDKKFKMKNVSTGSILDLELSTEEIKNLPRNKDLLIEATLIFKDGNALQNSGNYNSNFIYLTDGYVLKTFGEPVSEEKPLNDVVANRVFWHKIWEGGGNRRRWELALDCKYLCVYKYDSDTNGRMQTRMQLTDGSTDDENRLDLKGKMKSGMEISPVELNRLLPALGNYPELSAGQLKALMSDDLEKSMNQEANLSVQLKGKRDQRGVLWTYPELKVHQIVLQKVNAGDENGQVTATADETVYFPRVSSIHFIGARTDAP